VQGVADLQEMGANLQRGSSSSAGSMLGHVQVTVKSAWHAFKLATDGEVNLSIKDIFSK
jgi:hypothetical protein